MATAAKDDTTNYYWGLGLFLLLVPLLFWISVVLSPRGESTRPHVAAPAAAPGAEAAPAAPAAE